MLCRVQVWLDFAHSQNPHVGGEAKEQKNPLFYKNHHSGKTRIWSRQSGITGNGLDPSPASKVPKTMKSLPKLPENAKNDPQNRLKIALFSLPKRQKPLYCSPVVILFPDPIEIYYCVLKAMDLSSKRGTCTLFLIKTPYFPLFPSFQGDFHQLEPNPRIPSLPAPNHVF